MNDFMVSVFYVKASQGIMIGKKLNVTQISLGINFFMYFSWRNQINKIKNMTKTRLLIASLKIFVRS